MLSGCLYIFYGEMSVKSFAHFSVELFVFLLLSLGQILNLTPALAEVTWALHKFSSAQQTVLSSKGQLSGQGVSFLRHCSLCVCEPVITYRWVVGRRGKLWVTHPTLLLFSPPAFLSKGPHPNPAPPLPSPRTYDVEPSSPDPCNRGSL